MIQPPSVYLTKAVESLQEAAIVDIDDPDDVLDLVIDRELALQIDEGIPVYVIPIQTPDRILAAMRRAMARQRPSASART